MKAEIRLCDSVCVMGDGPIGLMLAQLSLACGATHVYVLGLQEDNLKLAKTFGCIPMVSGPGDRGDYEKDRRQRRGCGL